MFEKSEIMELSEKDWRRKVFYDFSRDLTSKDPKFPCVFGASGFQRNELKFDFFPDVDTESIKLLGGSLLNYLRIAKKLGNYTSFVSFFNIDTDKSIEEYEAIFWNILNTLHKIDPQPWPDNIPQNTNDAHWEFSFGGEPIFVVCNTPAHSLRKSRHAGTFMITFQPRWVFDKMGLLTPKGEKYKKIVRELISKYDSIPEYPYLGTYGNKNNKEWLQYFIPESNDVQNIDKCPFHHLQKEERVTLEQVKYLKGNKVDLEAAVFELLPETGSVEVQRDTPYREHKTHTHPTNETLLIIKGDIIFRVGEKELHCEPGDRILLPANTKHSSIAGSNGCLYIIALEYVTPNNEKVGIEA
ncbi:YqcI/YcgG family protein [Weizmannia sp. FSL W8-1119]|uniref:YqcI/YcgG family protein n=1 Tax=Weizmannia sp. FSL W8-1119 TaxID=2954709 RepID=UPI0030FACA3D